MFRRILACLLAGHLVLGSVPVTAGQVEPLTFTDTTPSANNTSRASTLPEETLPTIGANGLIQPVTGSVEGMTPIGTQADLAKLAAGGDFYLTNDIALQGDWVPITCAGTLTIDGRGYTISGLTNALLYSAEGILTVRNLQLEGEITGDAGGIVGTVSNITMSNCHSKGDVTCSAPEDTFLIYTGGVIGNGMARMHLANCTFDGNIGYGTRIGGLIGNADSQYLQVVDCYVFHPLVIESYDDAPVHWAGGFTGTHGRGVGTSDAKRLYANCTVEDVIVHNYGTEVTGAAVFTPSAECEYEQTPAQRFENCSVNGNVYVNNYNSHGAAIGSMLGYCQSVLLANCWIYGDVILTEGCESTEP